MTNATESFQPSRGVRIVKLSDYRRITREIPPPSVDHESIENSLAVINTLLATAIKTIEKLRAEVHHG
ncbi:hypothetical protein [Burkholderia anthina]|uniref:hypothetical protein n=1 Tax=Burkholderia anthina TaxID=179879 RepID=UPI00158D9E1D|nr:hypothetical protein [Burkholderia anthina]